MISPVEAVTAILLMFPHMSGNNRQCIIDHRPQIEQVLTEAQRQYPEMPTEVFAAVGFMETHLGCDQGEGGNWGLQFLQQDDISQELLCKLQQSCGVHMKYVGHGKVPPVDLEQVCAEIRQ